ncbi:hypothetical protein pdam_00015175 [Pocillopora damicornis]|uniref:Uncharacterized protein n=1 Tax=Pocillopora damicornis TaxID=46731 RepID=A0A3M6UFC6_POCDA|nr:hypothetical protein pdam_00015175 [Pocillopora damicornis]
MYGWWVSRDGENMKNWGGLVSVDYECTCLNNTCANTNYGCNCDMSDRTWREEGAFLKDKFMLLVKQPRFGDALYYSDVCHAKQRYLSIYRYPTGRVSVSKFKRDRLHYLKEEKLASSMVEDKLAFTFLC